MIRSPSRPAAPPAAPPPPRPRGGRRALTRGAGSIPSEAAPPAFELSVTPSISLAMLELLNDSSRVDAYETRAALFDWARGAALSRAPFISAERRAVLARAALAVHGREGLCAARRDELDERRARRGRRARARARGRARAWRVPRSRALRDCVDGRRRQGGRRRLGARAATD